MPKFGDLEAEIMDQIWRADDPVPVRDVVQAIQHERHVAFTTVQTVMEILFHKGWLGREKRGRAYWYWAARPREEYSARLLGEAFDTTADRGAAFARLLQQMEPDEVAELAEVLEQTKRQGNSR